MNEPLNDPSRKGEPSSDRLGRLLAWSLGAVAVVGFVTLAVACAGRIGSRYPLEWMEGTSLQHALWLAHGKLPYAAPSAELIAYLYPPLAYVPMAVASVLLSPSLPVARGVSVACMLATLALLGRAGARYSGSGVAGLFGAGLFAFGYGYGGAFLDLVRVDAFFLLCIAAAAERSSAGRTVPALAWLVASALAKQHGAILLAALSLWSLLRDSRRHAAAVAAAWSGLILVFMALQLASDGWLARYTLAVPSQHGLEPGLLLSFLLVDLGVYLPVLIVASALTWWRRKRALGALDVLGIAAVVVSALGRAHPGGDDNVRLPALALLCVVGAAPLVARALRASPLSAETGKSGAGARWALVLALCGQAAWLWQPPQSHWPAADSDARFAALEQALRRCAHGGRAVALDYGSLTSVPFIHTMALSDLRLGERGSLANAGTDALLAALKGPAAPAAIAVGEHFPELDAVLAQHYALCATVPAPRPVTGYQPGWQLAGRQRVQKVFARASAPRWGIPDAAATR